MTTVLRRWYPQLRRILPVGVRHLIRYPLSGLRSRWYDLQYAVRGPVTLRVRPDWTVRCHPATVPSFFAHMHGSTFQDELAHFVGTCTPGMTLIDVGAHYGVFTLAALHYGGPDAHVIAIDPSPHAQRYLAVNLALNGAAPRVRCLAQALSDTPKPIAMLTTGAGQAHMMLRPEEGRSDSVGVAATTLDEIAAGAGRPVTHVKIDVEGYEGHVLRGGTALLRDQRPTIALELHNDLLRQLGDDPHDLVALLERAGYWCQGDDGRPVPWASATVPHIARVTAVASAS